MSRSVIFLTLTIALSAVSAVGQKLKPEEIIAKHLEAIGIEAKRQELKSLFATGISEFEAKNPSIKGGGKAVVISDPSNLYMVMSFNSREYPLEKIGAFKESVSLPHTLSGGRSLLGMFLAEHSKILLENLFGGSMSLRWINHISEHGKSRLRSAGTKKINGREAHALDVIMPGIGSDNFKVKLYFDATTFHHLRSEYKREVDVGRVEFGQQSQQANARVSLVEEFSAHKTFDGVTLPHNYMVTYASNSNSTESSWAIKVGEYYFNQKLAPDFFSFDKDAP